MFDTLFKAYQRSSFGPKTFYVFQEQTDQIAPKAGQDDLLDQNFHQALQKFYKDHATGCLYFSPNMVVFLKDQHLTWHHTSPLKKPMVFGSRAVQHAFSKRYAQFGQALRTLEGRISAPETVALSAHDRLLLQHQQDYFFQSTGVPWVDAFDPDLGWTVVQGPQAWALLEHAPNDSCCVRWIAPF